MDEIDWLKNTKRALVFFIKFFGFFAICFAILTLLASTVNDWEYTKSLLLIALLIGIGFPSIIGICYFILIIFSKILFTGRTVINFDKEYIRDLPQHCSPAISSLIYDLKIDVYKDYTATILYLCVKKYLNLVKYKDTYKIELVKESRPSYLGRCEKYILDIFENKTQFDENQFKKELIREAQEKELITNRKYSKITKIIFILLLIISSLIITYNVSKIVFTILISILGSMIYVGYFLVKANGENQITLDFVDTEYFRTKKGKDMALFLNKLKRYIKEYTLISDKKLDYIQILENYIPYALVLDEADAVEEFIKYNDDYRNLIYNRKNCNI